MTFSVLFWNIWLENQINGEANAGLLIGEFARLIERYNPDIIGLNELLQHIDHTEPYIVKLLKTHGYKYAHFAPASPYTHEWTIGSGVASKQPLSDLDEIELGYDTRADRRGFPGHTVKAISCKVEIVDKTPTVIVSHLTCLRGHTLKDHYQQSQKLKNYFETHAQQDTIIGGDFNEPSFMPKSFRKQVGHTMHHKSGSKLNPTWSHNAGKLTPLRANLDQLYWSRKSNFTLQKFEVIDSQVSDHKPLFAIFEY